MNIYLLSQTETTGYDTYDICVVLAKSEEEAKLLHPNGCAKYSTKYNGFVREEDVFM